MLDERTTVDFTRQELELIEQALQTQKKILSVQNRAGSANVSTRLNDLKGLLKRLNRKTTEVAQPRPCSSGDWTNFARTLFL